MRGKLLKNKMTKEDSTKIKYANSRTEHANLSPKLSVGLKLYHFLFFTFFAYNMAVKDKKQANCRWLHARRRDNSIKPYNQL